jgi:hypothetical protein
MPLRPLRNLGLSLLVSLAACQSAAEAKRAEAIQTCDLWADMMMTTFKQDYVNAFEQRWRARKLINRCLSRGGFDPIDEFPQIEHGQIIQSSR